MAGSTLFASSRENGFGFFNALILAAGIVAAGFLLAHAIQDFRQYDQFIEVRGLAEEVVKSDQASWNLSFAAFGESPEATSQSWNTQIEKLEAALLAMGFEASEIRRQPLTVYESNLGGGSVDSARRFRAQGGIILETKKVDEVHKASVKTDVFLTEKILLESSDVQFYFTDLNSIKPRMLKAATDNAKAAAQTFASDSGVSVGALKTATQGLFSISAPLSESGGESTLMKKVRVVTRVQYLIK